MKLNLGCGRNILEGWINIDGPNTAFGVGVDYGVDLELPAWRSIFEPDTVEEFLLSHVLEHIHKPLTLLETMWHVAKPGALATVRVPYGSSDDADEDPTHVRRFFLGSWGYFGQPNYWRADYGYRGDWKCRRVLLRVDGKRLAEMGYEQTLPHVLDAVNGARNVCVEMVAELVAVKPAREPKQELATPWAVDAEIL